MSLDCKKCGKCIPTLYSFECKTCFVKYCSKLCKNLDNQPHQRECLRNHVIEWEDIVFPVNQQITRDLFFGGYMYIALQEAKKDEAKNALLQIYIDDYLEGKGLEKDDVSICSGELKMPCEKDRIYVSIKLLIKEVVVSDYLVSFDK